MSSHALLPTLLLMALAATGCEGRHAVLLGDTSIHQAVGTTTTFQLSVEGGIVVDDGQFYADVEDIRISDPKVVAVTVNGDTFQVEALAAGTAVIEVDTTEGQVTFEVMSVKPDRFELVQGYGEDFEASPPVPRVWVPGAELDTGVTFFAGEEPLRGRILEFESDPPGLFSGPTWSRALAEGVVHTHFGDVPGPTLEIVSPEAVVALGVGEGFETRDDDEGSLTVTHEAERAPIWWLDVYGLDAKGRPVVLSGPVEARAPARGCIVETEEKPIIVLETDGAQTCEIECTWGDLEETFTVTSAEE